MILFFLYQPKTQKMADEITDIVIESNDMSKYFTDGQKIRHTFDYDKTWLGTFDLSNNGICYDDNIYKSFGSFALDHYKNEVISCGIFSYSNGCYCEINGKWVQINYIYELLA